MNALDLLNAYLRDVERRLRLSSVARGLALLAGVALVATLVLVLFTNALAFSTPSVVVARVMLFLALAFAVGLGLVLPLIRLNKRRAARLAEEQVPAFEERLLTFAEAKKTGVSGAFLELLAEDALPVTRLAEPHQLITPGRIAALAGSACAAAGVLIWLTIAGPGFLGYGSSLLWAGAPRGTDAPFYDIQVFPGNKTVRRGGDQLISASLVGFETPNVRLFARYESASKWEEVPMQPQSGGIGFEFLFAGVPEPVEYYVEAGAVQTDTYQLSVVDLPKIKSIQVTYHFPSWMRRNDETEENGGDLRAVAGTEATVLIETDKPLSGGRLMLDDGAEVALSGSGGTRFSGAITIERDGLYHVAVREQDETVRVSEDYFIEAMPESAPTIRVNRPGRDYKANPIEEVTFEVQAEDDYGLDEVSLRYSVNGGEEKTIPLLGKRGLTEADATSILYLEDHDLVPGDLIAFYGLARDARTSSRTDMFFIEAQPYEREYSQSQMAGGGGGGGQQEEEGKISQRQKEIIAATWNLINDESRDRQRAAEDGAFLSEVQLSLKEQAESLSRRMKARQLAGANEEFQAFTENMDAAAEAMGSATETLTRRSWRKALQPEQKALQHLLRAEAVFRKIQVAQGSQGGGGGGGNMGRDLENLFDLELDTEKNQYETGQQAAGGAQQSQEIDEALQKLAELARRQQELAQQQKNNEQSFQQRWQQEMLRREAEELRRQMEQMQRQQRQSNQMQRGQQQGRQQGQQQSASSQQSGQPGQQGDQRLDQALERLKQATEDMRHASSSGQQSDGQRDAQSQRAAERLQEATDLLNRMRRQEAGSQLEDIAERASQLAGRQREFAEKLRELYKDHQAVSGEKRLREPAPPDPKDVMALAEEKAAMSNELSQLENEMQQAVRDLASGQKSASSKLREALGEMQQNELGLRMKYLSEWISRGLGAYAWLREAPVTQGLNRLAEQTREAQEALGQGQQQEEGLESALSRVEKLRRELEKMARGQQGQQPGDQRGGQQPGNQQQAGRQQGQGQQGSQPGQAQGQGQGQGEGQSGRQGSPPGMRPPQDGGGSGKTFSAMNTGEGSIQIPNGQLTPQQARAMEQTYREGLRDLGEIRNEVRDKPEMSREVAQMIRDMKKLDPSRFRGNPELVEELLTQVLPGLEQIELRLRRELEGDDAGQAKAVLSRPVPAGYADAVAEYYRKLSRGQ